MVQDAQALRAAEQYPLIQAGYCKSHQDLDGTSRPRKVVTFAVERGFTCHSVRDALPVLTVSPEEGNVAYLPVGTATERHMHITHGQKDDNCPIRLPAKGSVPKSGLSVLQQITEVTEFHKVMKEPRQHKPTTRKHEIVFPSLQPAKHEAGQRTPVLLQGRSA